MANRCQLFTIAAQCPSYNVRQQRGFGTKAARVFSGCSVKYMKMFVCLLKTHVLVIFTYQTTSYQTTSYQLQVPATSTRKSIV